MNEDSDRALLFIRDVRPIIDNKYDLMKHPNIKLCADGGAPEYYHNHLEVPEDLCLSVEQVDSFLNTIQFEEDDKYYIQDYDNNEVDDMYLNPADQQDTTSVRG